MNNFAKIKDGKVVKYPYALNELHAEFPELDVRGITIDIMELFLRHNQSDYELVEVEIAAIPEYKKTIEKVRLEEIPVFENGKWILKWIIELLTPEERMKILNLTIESK